MKVPLFIGTQVEEKPCLWLNLGIIISANVLSYGIMRLVNSKIKKKKANDSDVKF